MQRHLDKRACTMQLIEAKNYGEGCNGTKADTEGIIRHDGDMHELTTVQFHP